MAIDEQDHERESGRGEQGVEPQTPVVGLEASREVQQHLRRGRELVREVDQEPEVWTGGS